MSTELLKAAKAALSALETPGDLTNEEKGHIIEDLNQAIDNSPVDTIILKPQLWVVTGYSGKYDGLLYVIQADSADAACRKVCEIEGAVYIVVDVDHFNDGSNITPTHNLIHRTPSATGDSNVNEPETDEELALYIKDSYENGEGPRRFWQITAAPYTMNVNLKEAVIW